MGNRLDKSISRIVSDVDACIARVLTATVLENQANENVPEAITRVREEGQELLAQLKEKTKLGSESYRFGQIAKELTKVREILVGIETERVLSFRRDRQKTDAIFENKLQQATNEIGSPSHGLLEDLSGLFHDPFKPPTVTSLNLAHEIRGKVSVIQRRIKVLKRPILGVLLSWKPAIAVLLVGLLLVPVMYSRRASAVQKAPVVNAVRVQVNSDAKAVASALKEPGKSSLEHGIGAIQQISSIVSTVPKVLTGCSLLLALIQYIFVKQRWRQRSIDEFRADLTAASDALKKWRGAQ